MKSELHILWKTRVVLPADAPAYAHGSKLFNPLTGGQLLHSIGAGLDPALQPVVLNPTNIFYNAIRRCTEDLHITEKKLPFECSFGRTRARIRVNFNFHLYGDRLLITTIRLGQFAFDGLPEEIGNLQDLRNDPTIYKLTKTVLGLITCGKPRGFPISNDPKFFPCLAVIGREPLPDDEAVGVLTRHGEVSKDVVDAVIGKNSSHQIDDNSFLLDRQGLLCRISQKANNDRPLRRFQSACGLLELAIATAGLGANLDSMVLNPTQRAAISRLITKPESMFAQSVTGGRMWKLLRDEFKLSEEAFAAKPSNEPIDRVALERPHPIEQRSWKAAIWGAALSGVAVLWGLWIYFNPSPSENSIPRSQQKIDGSGNTVIQGSNNTITLPPLPASPKDALPPATQREAATKE